jgi:hypothetical protein
MYGASDFTARYQLSASSRDRIMTADPGGPLPSSRVQMIITIPAQTAFSNPSPEFNPIFTTHTQ